MALVRLAFCIRALVALAVCSEEIMANEPDIAYEELLKGVEGKTLQVFDVRNPDEIAETGKIPTSTNIPLPEWTQALQLSSTDFRFKYNVTKPTPADSNVVLTCRSGARAAKANEQAEALGYNKVRIYRGSILDWQANHGQVEH